MLVLSAGLAFAAGPATVFTEPGASSPTPATITYSKVFPGSTPEYVWIEVREDGEGRYEVRRIAEEPRPLPFRVPLNLTQKIFDLSSQLKNFQGASLEFHRRIAQLGKKTFRYQRG